MTQFIVESIQISNNLNIFNQLLKMQLVYPDS